MVADASPSAVSTIKVAADDRTVVVGIIWEAGCLELSHVTVTEKPAEVAIAVFYGKAPGAYAYGSPDAGSVTVTCTAVGHRPGYFFTVVQLSAPVSGRKIVDLGQAPSG